MTKHISRAIVSSEKQGRLSETLGLFSFERYAGERMRLYDLDCMKSEK